VTGHDDNDERGRTRALMTEHDDGDVPGAGGDPVRCPFCDATTVSTVAPFGSQLLMSQFRCEACRSYFEGVRLDR
jgi:hypothetical protein